MRGPSIVPCGTPELTVVEILHQQLPFDIVWLAKKRSIEEEVLVYHRSLIVFCEGLCQKP